MEKYSLSYRENKDTCKPMWPAPNPGLPHSGSQHNLDRLQVLVKLWLCPEDALWMGELPEIFTVLNVAPFFTKHTERVACAGVAMLTLT